MKIVTFVGTRPEIIKLSATLRALDRFFDHTLVHTGQHYDYELGDIFFEDLGIRYPDRYLSASRESAAECIGDIIKLSDSLLRELRPDAILIYGDTNSALCAYSAKRLQIPIFHMEAGNRCFDPRVPEEINRKIVDHLSDVNLTISEQARYNLLREGLLPNYTFKIGSSMPEVIASMQEKISQSNVLDSLGVEPSSFYLVSIHREENVSRPEYMDTLMDLLRSLDAPIVFSGHPRFRNLYSQRTAEFPIDNVMMLKPFGFSDYIHLQTQAKCVISDSGSLMEEADLLGFPAVTIRNSHERPEAMECASVSVASWDLDHISDSVKIAMARSEDVKARAFSAEGYKVADYRAGDTVSMKVVNIISSYTGQVRRKVWYK